MHKNNNNKRPLLPQATARCTYQLIREQQHRLQSEYPLALLKQVLDVGAQKVHHEATVVLLHTKQAHMGHTHCSATPPPPTAQQPVSHVAPRKSINDIDR